MTNERLPIGDMVQIWREASQFVAHATPIDIMSCGETPEAARKALDEAVSLFVRTAADHGTLEEVLDESGYEFPDGVWRGPDWVGVERHTISVIA